MRHTEALCRAVHSGRLVDRKDIARAAEISSRHKRLELLTSEWCLRELRSRCLSISLRRREMLSRGEP